MSEDDQWSGEDTIRFDPHVHTAASHDARGSVADVLQQADDGGLAAIGITDHDTVDGAQRALDIQHRYDVLVVPGVEISTADGHLLGLGVSEQPPVGQSLVGTVEWVRDRGGIAVVPHPFQSSRHGVAPHISAATLASADAIEVYNSRLLTGRSNRKAERFAAFHDLPMTAGSDAHIAEMVGQAVTEVDTDERMAESILAAIADGRTSVVGRRTPWRISFRQAAGGAKRRLVRALGDLL